MIELADQEAVEQHDVRLQLLTVHLDLALRRPAVAHELGPEVVVLPLALPAVLAPPCLLLVDVQFSGLFVVLATVVGFDFADLGLAAEVVPLPQLTPVLGRVAAGHLFLDPLLPHLGAALALGLEFDFAHLRAVEVDFGLARDFPLELDFALVDLVVPLATVPMVVGVRTGVRVRLVPIVDLFLDLFVVLLDFEVAVSFLPLDFAVIVFTGLLDLDFFTFH